MPKEYIRVSRVGSYSNLTSKTSVESEAWGLPFETKSSPVQHSLSSMAQRFFFNILNQKVGQCQS